MSKSITLEDSFSQFEKEARKVIELALHLGWRGYWTSTQRQMVRLHSPKNEVEFTVPSTNVNSKRARSWVTRIHRYTDPEVLAQYLDGNPTPPAQPERPKQHAAAVLTGVPEPSPVLLHVKAAIEREERGGGVPVVIAERPWMARRGKNNGRDDVGRMYESQHTIEQTMSDGSTRYKCKSCDYTSDNGASVGRHSGKAHRKQERPTQERLIVVPDEVYGPVEPRPSTAAHRLAVEITRALDGIADWTSMSPTDLAEAVAHRVYEERPEREPMAPLTPEQMIERIANLVDDGRLGQMHLQVKQMTDALREATSQAETAKTAAVEAEQEAERLREERRVLASLLADDGAKAATS